VDIGKSIEIQSANMFSVLSCVGSKLNKVDGGCEVGAKGVEGKCDFFVANIYPLCDLIVRQNSWLHLGVVTNNHREVGPISSTLGIMHLGD